LNKDTASSKRRQIFIDFSDELFIIRWAPPPPPPPLAAQNFCLFVSTNCISSPNACMKVESAQCININVDYTKMKSTHSFTNKRFAEPPEYLSSRF
jgi:hypothetical protein